MNFFITWGLKNAPYSVYINNTSKIDDEDRQIDGWIDDRKILN